MSQKWVYVVPATLALTLAITVLTIPKYPPHDEWLARFRANEAAQKEDFEQAHRIITRALREY